MRFVVQQHNPKYEVRGLHWDLRMEMDGVLKTWALAKEPVKAFDAPVPADQIDDKDLGYLSFEGIIPEGEPGAGSVAIWDRGTYLLKDRVADQINLLFQGRRVKGVFVLKRVEGKKWLLARG